ncbi:dihydrolipoamide acetyltransferase family protein [Cytobacillus firmus]|uniref:dihydrolipoamide acetyltransferase family protein n=1 Tax=Cytobacillus firmus TaxID=1399 RepID=UPI0036BC4C9F
MVSLSHKPSFVTPRAKARAKELGISLAEIEGSGPNGRIIEQDVIYYTECIPGLLLNQLPQKTHQLRKITPLAKNISKFKKVNLEQIQGTGINGKIVSADVLKEINESNSVPYSKKVPLSGVRKVIAARMSNSKKIAPHVTLTVKTEVTNLVKYRDLLKQRLSLKVSYTDLLVKIVAESLREHKDINVSLDGEMLVYHNDINIGIAVAQEQGLIVPVIKNAAQKTIDQISFDVNEKVNKARTGKLKPTDLEKGRFTISNLGMYEIDAFTPVINQPESAILGVGRIIEDIIVENSQIRIGKTMVLSLAFDHRVMDGAPAAKFLGKIKQLIENPEEIISIQN